MSKKLSYSIAMNLLTDKFKKGTNTVKNGFRSMQAQITTFALALGVGGLGLSEFIGRFKEVARETNRVITALKNVSVGTKGFAESLTFLNKLADKYGLKINMLVGNFAKFTATATASNMSMQTQQKVFESLSRATTAFGLSGDDANGVFLALSQMISKGKVSSEELRLQMGERLPVALQAMAKAAGVSMAGLDKLMKQGKLMSADVIPKFAKALDEMIPNVDTDNLETSLNRLSNSFHKIVDASGFQNTYKALVDSLNVLMQGAMENMKGLAIGVIAAIAMVATNGAVKVAKSWDKMASSMTSNYAKQNADLLRATSLRVSIEKQLENQKLKHGDAIGKQKIALAKQIAAQEIMLSKVVAIEDAARGTNYTKLNKDLLRATSIRVSTENQLEKNKLQHRVTEGKQQTKLAKRIAAQEIILSKAVAAQDTARTALQNANSVNRAGVATRAMNAIKLGAAKMTVALKAAWSSFAPGLIIAGLVAIGGWLKKLYDDSKRLERATADYNGEVAKEAIGINRLFSELRNATKGTDEYNTAKTKILSQYGEHLKGLSDEVRSLEDVEGAYKAVSRAAIQAAADRVIASTTEEATDDYINKYKKQANILKQAVKGQFGSQKEEDQFLKNVLSQLTNKGELDKPTQDTIDSLGKDVMLSSGGVVSTSKMVHSNPAAAAVKGIKRDQKVMDDQINKIMTLFGGSSQVMNKVDASLTNDDIDEDLEIIDIPIDKVAIEGSIAWYEEKIKKLKELQESARTEEEYNGFQTQINRNQNAIADLDGSNIENAKTEAEKLAKLNADKLSKMRDQYMGYLEAQKKLDEEYNSSKALMVDNKGNLKNGYTQAHVDNLDAEKAVEDEALALDVASKQEAFEVFTNQLADASLMALQEMINDAQMELIKLDATGRQDGNAIALAKGKATKAKEALASKQKGSGKDTEALRDIEEWAALEDQLRAVSGEFTEMGDSIGGAAGDALKFVGNIAADTTSMISSINQFAQGANRATVGSAQTASAAVKAVESASVILAIISAAIQIATKIAEIFTSNRKAEEDHERALKEMTERKLAQQKEYNAALREEKQARAEDGGIFGSDPYGSAQASLDRYREARKELKSEMGGTLDDANKYDALADKYDSGFLADMFRAKAEEERELFKKGIEGISEIEMVTGSKTVKKGWFRKEQKDVYGSILEEYPKLIEANGDLNDTLAETILETEKISDADKERLQGLIDLQQEMEESLAAMQDYYKDIFDGFGLSAMDAFIEKLKGTKDAVSDFVDDAGGMLGDLVSGFIYSMRIAPIIQKVSEEATDLLMRDDISDDEKNKQFTNLTGGLIDSILGQENAVISDLEHWGKVIEEQTGVNPFSDKDSEQTASSGGFESMSQDTGNKLDGRFAAMQMSLARLEGMISSSMSAIVIRSGALLNGNAVQITELKKQTTLLGEIKASNVSMAHDLQKVCKVIKEIPIKLDKIEKNTSKI